MKKNSFLFIFTFLLIQTNFIYAKDIKSTAKIKPEIKSIVIIKPEIRYDENIKWEETATYNVALDFGFFQGRISGTAETYLRKTNDLINTIPVP